MHVFGPFFYVTGLGWAIATGTFATLWWRARARAKAAEQRLGAPLPALGASATDNVQLALDAMAVEVERIGEAQRFTSSLLGGQTRGAGAQPGQATAAEHRAPQANDR